MLEFRISERISLVKTLEADTLTWNVLTSNTDTWTTRYLKEGIWCWFDEKSHENASMILSFRPQQNTISTQCLPHDSDLIFTVLIKLVDVRIFIIATCLMSVHSVCDVFDSRTNHSVSSTNNTPKKNDLKKWISCLQRWTKKIAYENFSHDQWIRSILTIRLHIW